MEFYGGHSDDEGDIEEQCQGMMLCEMLRNGYCRCGLMCLIGGCLRQLPLLQTQIPVSLSSIRLPHLVLPMYVSATLLLFISRITTHALFAFAIHFKHYNIILVMGQQSSQFLDCRLFKRDNSSQIKHQQLLKDLRLMQQESQQKKALSLKQLNNKSPQESLPKQTPPTQQKIIVNHDHILKYSTQPFSKSMEYQSGGFIEIPEMSLSDILQAKLNTSMFFPPNDIHAMLGGLLSAMSYLQTNNINHHDIYPSSIYYSNNRYKLSNPLTTQSSYQRTFHQKRFSYLSPELIEALVNGVTIQDHTLLFKPDVYSLGMVMLEYCSLKSSSQCYDPETYDIVEVNIRNRLNAIEARYSTSVSSLIRSMLEPDPKKRMSASQIFEIFQQSQSMPPPPRGIAPVDIPVAPVKNIQRLPTSGRDSVVNPATDRISRQYNIVVTPPPTSNLGNSLNHSIVAPGGVPRPPTFNPPVRRETANRAIQRLATEPVNLQEVGERVDRILANSRRYN